MNTPPEDFEKLRKLLKLKRYEQPPPGYFNNFSGKVIARLQRDGGASRVDILSAEAPWVKKLVRMLETKPIFAGVFGVAFCALLIFGITSFQDGNRTSVAMMGDEGNAGSSGLLVKAVSDTTTFSPSINPRFSTNFSPFGSLTMGAQPTRAEPVMYSPGQ